MTERDFCYWLQGFFELTGWENLNGFTPEQEQCIRKHMALVAANDKTPSAFCAFVDGVLSSGSERAARVVSTRLNLHFEHVIDKQYADQDKLNSIHGSAPGGPVYRC